MQCPGYVDPGGPSWREKARKVDYAGKLHLFTRRDIRANLPLNAALRAVLTFKTLSPSDLFIYAYHAYAIAWKQINIISIILPE